MIVSVFPSREYPGVSTLADFSSPAIRHGFCVDWERAFLESWPCDAHVSSYRVTGTDRWPRINQTALQHVREAGADVECHLLGIDCDCPGHMPWDESPISQEQWRAAFSRACQMDARLEPWACLYFTRAGARIFYALAEPIAPEQFRTLAEGVVTALGAQGIVADKLVDWNRLMRLPMVLRDGIPTIEEEYFDIDWRPEKRLHARPMLEAAEGRSLARLYVDMAKVPGQFGRRPEDEDAHAMLEVMVGGRWRQTEFAKTAKKLLSGRNPLYDAAFCGGDICDNLGPGANTAITEQAGVACGMLVGALEYVEPRHIYALLAQAVGKIAPYKDNHTREHWQDAAWDIVCRIWRKEKGHALAIKQEEDARVARMQESVKQAASVFWLSDPRRGNSNAMEALRGTGGMTDEDAIRSVGLAVRDGHFFVMKPNGMYTSKPVRAAGVAAEIRILGSEPIIPLTFVDDKGGSRDRSLKDIMDSHSITICEIRKRFMDASESGYIEGVASEYPVLWFALDSRNPYVTPRYDADVAEWIYCLDPSGKLAEWLSYAPAVEQGGICAFFLSGPRGLGKQMLVKGLAECFVNATYASAKEMVGDFQQKLARTCVIQIDEALPKANGAFGVDAAFRSIITNGLITINEKFMPQYDVYNSPRVIGTSNNPHLVNQLFPASNTEKDDRDAILERLILVETDAAAARFLSSRGGTNYTAAEGARWVKGNAGEPSDYILARHIMYLYANRKAKTGIPHGNQRLLVEGRQSGSSGAEMLGIGTSEVHSAVCEACIFLFSIESKRNKEDSSSGAWIDREQLRILVTASAVRDALMGRLSDKYPRQPGLSAISAALRCMRSSDSPKEALLLPARSGCGKVLWYEIDLEQVEAFAVELGGDAAAFLEFCDDARRLKEMKIQEEHDERQKRINEKRLALENGRRK